MPTCMLCDMPMKLYIDNMRDWEYGIDKISNLVICSKCGLVGQDPEITSEEIPSLYPSNYLAHTPAPTSVGIYGLLKAWLANRTARKIVANVPSNGVCLEIGCGNGHLMQTISKIRPDIRFIGVDIKKVKIANLPKFTFLHGQFEDVAIDNSSIDLVYCSNLIEHVPVPTVFATKIKAVLKPGGSLLGVTPDHLSFDRYLFGKYWAGYHYPRHIFIFNHSNIITLLERSGLEAVKVAGSYSFWYLSLANRFMDLPGAKKRGIVFAAITAAFLPLDMLINLITCHGSMSFTARAPEL